MSIDCRELRIGKNNSTTLFDDDKSGAVFSANKKYRYSLWRIWDKSKPLVMFIGLNPSTANKFDDDNTIESVTRITKSNNYGGFYMMNCWAYIATKPENLIIDNHFENINNKMLEHIGQKCATIVFAWGNFKIVSQNCRDIELSQMFPNAMCLHKNKNGSPKHPLYCKSDTKFIIYKHGN